MSQVLYDERQLQIIDATTLILAIKPNATLGEIAEHIGVSKATLHRHFAGRESLIIGVAHRALDAIFTAMDECNLEEGSVADVLPRLAEQLIPLGDKFYFIINEQIWDIDEHLISTSQSFDEIIISLLERGQKEGTIRKDISAIWMVYLFNFSIFATWQAIHDGNLAPRDAPRQFITGLISGIGQP